MNMTTDELVTHLRDVVWALHLTELRAARAEARVAELEAARGD